MTDSPISLPVRGSRGRLGTGSVGSLPVWRGVAVLTTILAVFVAWLFLAPPQLGGSTTYVVTTGESMLPDFHKGDLVILRREPSYHVGQVAGYHSDLGVTVMHRIVAERDGHFVFKGDNNDFVDSYEPTKSEIVGAEWVHLPGAGRFLAGVRSPAVAAVLLGAIWVVGFSPGRRSRRQRRRHRHGR